jgi:glycerol uptake facilitator-like aquaporin
MNYFEKNEMGLFVAFLYEYVATFFLVLIVFSLGVHQKLHVSIVGTAVGTYLTCAILCIGKWTGGALNPTRVLGPAFMSGNLFAIGWWVYYLAPIAGGVSAGVFFEFLMQKDVDEVREERYKQ